MSEKAGLSILIPVYNYVVTGLVKDIANQSSSLNIPYEILCFDDCSSLEYIEKNKLISDLPNCKFKTFDKNIGRAAIRNELAFSSTYQFILFIDADSKIIANNYIKSYWEKRNDVSVIAGGTAYSNLSNIDFTLRYKYGKSREEINAENRNKSPYNFIYLNNLFLPKSIFLKNPLDTSLTTYGHEDTKFGFGLKRMNIPIIHIENAVEHVGLETNSVFIEKTKEGIKNFYKILKEGYGIDSKLCKTYTLLKKFKLIILFNFFYSILKKSIEKNLLSDSPNLLYFDLFKLYLLIQEDKKIN